MKRSNTSGTSGGKGGTDWERLDEATDADIDFSDIPRLGEDFFLNAVMRDPKPRKMVSIRLEESILDWFKSQGPGYQTRIQSVLRRHVIMMVGAEAIRRGSGGGDGHAVKGKAGAKQKSVNHRAKTRVIKLRDKPRAPAASGR